MYARTVFVISIAVVGLAPPSAWGHKVVVHDALTARAAARSDNLQFLLNEFGLRAKDLPFADLDQVTAEYQDELRAENGYRVYGTTPLDLLRFGSVMEDYAAHSYSGRFFNHFYEPRSATTGKKLWSGGQHSARDWAFHVPRGVNERTWTRALEEYYRALTDIEPDDRDEAFAQMFYTLGHVCHLVEDMAAPPHVRDDAHPPWNPSPFEELGDGEIGGVLRYVNDILRHETIKIAAYETSEAYLGTLACFTTANFFSGSTVNQYEPFYTHPYAYPPPWCVTDEDGDAPGEGADPGNLFIMNESTLLSKRTALAHVSSLLAILAPELLSDLDEVRLRSSYDHPTVVVDNARQLFPVAVGHTAGLLEFFFRARLSARVKDVEVRDGDYDLVTYEITNVSRVRAGVAIETYTLAELEKLEFRALYETGVLGPPLDVKQPPNVSALEPGQSVEVQVWYPDLDEHGLVSASRSSHVVYDGQIGGERGVTGAVSRRGGVQLSYAAHGASVTGPEDAEECVECTSPNEPSSWDWEPVGCERLDLGADCGQEGLGLEEVHAAGGGGCRPASGFTVCRGTGTATTRFDSFENLGTVLSISGSADVTASPWSAPERPMHLYYDGQAHSRGIVVFVAHIEPTEAVRVRLQLHSSTPSYSADCYDPYCSDGEQYVDCRLGMITSRTRRGDGGFRLSEPLTLLGSGTIEEVYASNEYGEIVWVTVDTRLYVVGCGGFRQAQMDWTVDIDIVPSP
ncbi:MAG: hypothetical protein KKB50_10390 [Planctomycetes bacterium]|nr:hypothetical protein [Planctomycetota bacterium]